MPAAYNIAAASDGLFVIEDWHNFGVDYSRTLDAWFANFNRNWESTLSAHYDQRFYRMWKYYLHLFMGYFRSRRGQLWQLVLSRPTRSRVYRSLR